MATQSPQFVGFHNVDCKLEMHRLPVSKNTGGRPITATHSHAKRLGKYLSLHKRYEASSTDLNRC
jgi:hypothetical protein